MEICPIYSELLEMSCEAVVSVMSLVNQICLSYARKP